MLSKLFRLLTLVAVLGSTLGLLLTGCELREDVVTPSSGARLSTSLDTMKFGPTVLFDTVFTRRGSVTKRFWIYNRAANAVHVDEVALVGAEQGPSPYSLIIDGHTAKYRRDFDLRGKDSLQVLVKVNIDPTDGDTAFLVRDSVRLRANGGTSYVRLLAFGENAVYYKTGRDSIVVINSDETWTPQRPIVLASSTLVDSTAKLTILPGTRVYAASGVQLYVMGQLVAGRSDGLPVKFQGIRREYYNPTGNTTYVGQIPTYPEGDPRYADTPGQWAGIAFIPTNGPYGTSENVLENCDVRNATTGVLVSNNHYLAGHKLRIERTLIRNCFTAGVVGYGGGVGSGYIKLLNTAITNIGQYAVLGIGGGTYRLAYCTIATRSPQFRREDESLAFNDVMPVGDVLRADRLNVTIENSIVWSGLRQDNGDLRNEIVILHEGRQDSTLVFRNSLLQTTSARYNVDPYYNPGGAPGTNGLNQDPKFVRDAPGATAKDLLDLRLDTLSPASNIGRPLPGLPTDLLGVPRDGSTPDAGAYERDKP